MFQITTFVGNGIWKVDRNGAKFAMCDNYTWLCICKQWILTCQNLVTSKYIAYIALQSVLCASVVK